MNDNNLNPFYSTSQDGKPSLDIYEFRRFLEHSGFFKNIPNENSTFNLIKKNGIFLEIKDETNIKDFVLDYIIENHLGKSVYNLLAGKVTTFKRDFLSQISTKEIEILKDTKDTCYLFYENGVVEVKQDSQNLKKYSD